MSPVNFRPRSSVGCPADDSGFYGFHTLSFSPSGEYLTAACIESGVAHSLKLFDRSTNRQHSQPSLIGALYSHTELVYDLVWSNDSRRIASVGGD